MRATETCTGKTLGIVVVNEPCKNIRVKLRSLWCCWVLSMSSTLHSLVIVNLDNGWNETDF